jgi:hypothetical protein
MIKVETNRPSWRRPADLKAVSGFGETVPVPCTPLPALMADKIDAIIKKNRARHLYDLAGLLGRKTGVDAQVWLKLGGKGDPLDALVGRVKAFRKDELRKMAESLRPFLFDEREARLVEEADVIVPELVRQARGYMSGQGKAG